MEILEIHDLKKFCESVVSSFSDRQIVLLDGPLGAGKTELVKKMVKVLGAGETSSPTYSLINEYSVDHSAIYHIDLYRVDGEDDLESIGFWDLFESKKAIVFIEWSSRMDRKLLPLDWSQLSVKISKVEDDSKRLYEVTAKT